MIQNNASKLLGCSRIQYELEKHLAISQLIGYLHRTPMDYIDYNCFWDKNNPVKSITNVKFRPQNRLYWHNWWFRKNHLLSIIIKYYPCDNFFSSALMILSQFFRLTCRVFNSVTFSEDFIITFFFLVNCFNVVHGFHIFIDAKTWCWKRIYLH